MRVGLVRNVGLSITALAVLAIGGCNDNPLSFDVKDTVGIQTNPTAMVVASGRTAKLESRAVNQGNEPTFEAISAAIDATCGQGAITVEPDPDQLEIQPPGLFIVTAGSLLGQSCITLTSGSNTAQVEVTVVTDAIQITAPLDGTVYRAGDTDQVVAQLIDVDGNPVGPYAVEDATFVSDDTDVADFTDELGNFLTETSGSSTLTVTWSGQELNGTAGIGVIRIDEITIAVGANVPVAAAFEDTVFTTVGADVDQTMDVIVSDVFGNQNTDPAEIMACTATSSDPLVATATCELVGEDNVVPVVTVTSVAAGTADISGTVQVPGSLLIVDPIGVIVLAPDVTGISTPTGFVGTAVSITGTGLTAAGFATNVLVDGAAIDPIFIVSATDTQVDVLMPDLGNANDAFEIGIDVGGVAGPATVTYTQLADAAPDEPANDSPATPTVIPIPTDLVGSFEGADVDDFYLVTVTGAFTVDLDWDDHSVDLDILIDEEGLPFAFPCGFDGATGAAPEQHVCNVPAGNYLVWINNFSGPGSPTSYRLEIQ